METNDTIPWRLREGPATCQGALTEAHIVLLSATHEIGTDTLCELSKKLDGALSRQLNMTEPEFADKRADKGTREAKKALHHLGSVEKDLARALEIFRSLRFKNPFAHVGMPDPFVGHVAELEKAEESVKKFRTSAAAMARNGLISFKPNPDKRLIRDVRRQIVCTSIFNCWEEIGGKLTYTTDPITSERGGPLFEFANGVVECITEPPSRLSGSTMRSELDDFVAYRKAASTE
ncbi:hypothetical protein ACSBOB_08855 [Mesorhizobium sp. ASY16-5R]|uniref:hypothetical protein n=1 Tax=Mesorhizobium sp. ASY16-5R TaxID=3445772 RepID=UPI003FA09E13